MQPCERPSAPSWRASSAWRFVCAAGFHTDQAVFNDVGAADAVLRRNFVEHVEKINWTELRAVDAHRGASFKADFDFFGFVRSFFRRGGPLPHGFMGRIGGIFEFAAFVAEVPDVAVAAVDVFLALLDLHVVFRGVGDGVFSRIDVPFAPRGDDLNVWRNSFVGQLETDLIVPFSGAAVRETVGAELES